MRAKRPKKAQLKSCLHLSGSEGVLRTASAALNNTHAQCADVRLSNRRSTTSHTLALRT
jgi:hypothetical protein